MGERGIKDAIGDAIADARSRLIEEGWFGRRSGGTGQSDSVTLGWELETPHPRTDEERRALMSFEDAWAIRERSDKLDPDYDLTNSLDR